MDLLKNLRHNIVNSTRPAVRTGLGNGLAFQPAQAGSRAMRHKIIEDKPGKKVLIKHLEAMITAECESSSDEN
jgi:hypothetical protein